MNDELFDTHVVRTVADTIGVERCKSCRAPIKWAMTVDSKRMPLNAEPAKMFAIGSDGIARSIDAYTSHFATCPNADQHRKGGR